MKRLIGLVAALVVLGYSTSWAGENNPNLLPPDHCDVFDNIPYWSVLWTVPLGLVPALWMPPPVQYPPPQEDLLPPDHCCIFDSCPYWCPEWGVMP